MEYRFSWRRLRSLWSRFLPRGLLLIPRSSAPARALAPKAAPGRPRGSISVVPQGFPSRDALRLRPIARTPLTATPPRPPLLALITEYGWRGPELRTVRASAADPSASAARKASQRLALGAAEARRRRQDKHRRRVRRHTKRSMWREFQCQDFLRLAMFACCDDTTSDDDEHSTDNAALLLFGHALVAPLLLSRLSATDELFLALTCRFALDIFTIIQQDYHVALEEDTPFDLELENLG